MTVILTWYPVELNEVRLFAATRMDCQQNTSSRTANCENKFGVIL